MIRPTAYHDLTGVVKRGIELNDQVGANLITIADSVQRAGDRIGYQPAHFVLEEFVPKEIVDRYGDLAWQFIDDRILWTADAVWEYFKAPAEAQLSGRKYCMLINTWRWGGRHAYRGFRPPEHDRQNGKDGEYCSQHKHGRAIDFEIPGLSPAFLRDEVLKNSAKPDFRYITTLKLYAWGVHIDCRNTRQEAILELKG